MTTSPFFNAVEAAKATVRQIRDAPDITVARSRRPPYDRAVEQAAQRHDAIWSWRSTGDPGIFELWTAGESVAILSVLPGHIAHRAVLLDLIVDHLNAD